MGLFDRYRGKTIDEYVVEAGQVGATLVDVREVGEYQQGHIPGAVNIPLGSIDEASARIPDKGALLYVYCTAGMRSARACKQLNAAGFTKAVNIGGIGSYHGAVER